MTSSIRSCICCNPLFKQFITHLTRRKFLLGTGAFAAAVIGGNLGSGPAQAQTEGIRILSEEEEAVQGLTAPATIFLSKKVITMEPDQPEARAVGLSEGRIGAPGNRRRNRHAHQPPFGYAHGTGRSPVSGLVCRDRIKNYNKEMDCLPLAS
jgi:hypothetical protein